MAIDDNTLYGLTGLQVEDLADKVKAAQNKNYVWTNPNLSPAEDTPTAWMNLFINTATTGVPAQSGYFVTWYNQTGRFEHQPTQYGYLETFRNGADVYQRWYTMAAGPMYFRSGNGGGWKNPENGNWHTIPTIKIQNTDPGEGETLSAGKYIAVYGADPINNDYSTTEINTGQKWVDGKTIYKKTYDTGAMPNNNAKVVALSITNLDKVIRFEGWATAPSRTITRPLPFVSSDGSQNIALWIEGQNLRIRTVSDQTDFTASAVTLYYTKTA